MGQNRYILLPLLSLTPPTEGFPWDYLHKVFCACQRMTKVPLNAIEKLAKFTTAWVGCTSVTDRQTTDRQMDGRQQIANVNASSLKTVQERRSFYQRRIRSRMCCMEWSWLTPITPNYPYFYSARSARIASAVLATAIPSVRLSVCLSIRPSVRPSHAGIVSKRRHVARCSLHRFA